MTNAKPSITELEAHEAFIARHEAWQEQQQRTLDPAQVWTNYRMLQVWDLLGLYFCCAEPVNDYIEPVPTAFGASKTEGVRLTMTPYTTRRLALVPYPFDVRPLKVQLASKRLPPARFAELASCRRAYFQAPAELLELGLV